MRRHKVAVLCEGDEWLQVLRLRRGCRLLPCLLRESADLGPEMLRAQPPHTLARMSDPTPGGGSSSATLIPITRQGFPPILSAGWEKGRPKAEAKA